jgi:hypothetical protein
VKEASLPKSSTSSWLALGGATLAVAALLTGLSRVQPVGAQVGRPLANDFPITTGESAPALPSPPAQVQALDGTHFVVVTREPRLVRKASATEGPWQTMLLTVVTHYTVQANRLQPVEHVRVPTGYRAYSP